MMKPRTYCQLSAEERDIIAHRRAQGASLRAISKLLKRELSAISRELFRNRAPIYNIYLCHRAQKRARIRWCESHRRARLKSTKLRRFVRSKLKQGWSPELIAGWLRINRPQVKISYEAIYQFVYDRQERGS